MIIVTAASKRAVEDHFDRSLELEMTLREKGDLSRLAEIQQISDLADFVYMRQKEQKGVGHAVLQAKDVVGNEPFLLMFPDDVLVADVPVAKQMVDVFEERGGSVIAVQELPDSESREATASSAVRSSASGSSRSSRSSRSRSSRTRRRVSASSGVTS